MRIIAITILSVILLPEFLNAQRSRAEKVYEQVNEAVVKVLTFHADNSSHGQASGVVLKSKGWLITNFHVFGDAKSIFAEHGGRFLKLDSIVRADRKMDVLIMSIDMEADKDLFDRMPDLKIANDDKMRIGETVYAIGTPFGYENTITDGIISGLRASDDSSRNYIQISAPISTGSSGGAIVNAKGELIGISTFIIAGEGVQNINFAIPISDVLTFDPKAVRDISEGMSGSDYFKTGYQYFMANKFSLALPYFQQVNDISKNSYSPSLYYTARCFEELNQPDSALLYFKRTVMVEPRDAVAYLGIARMYLERGDTERALKYQQKAYQLNPDLRDTK